MAYLLLISEPRGQRETRTQSEGEALYARMVSYAEDLAKQGVLLDVQSLVSDADAARVEVREGRTNVTDGPFSEAKEMIGGFFLIDCATRDEALAFARACPAAQWASVEVRETGPCFR
ncbi:dehydrogenase [Paraburkholderia sp. Ac-20340]|uniref:YciI family protein n=1 Tax=Paraburkholderia sp. Ac-20340 TaxID=2703888 RepID=UPI00197D5697|nr:YciI family protein [Paraburkholderia sp. Ac-20340]MBN3856791.1 dehydrogenase [Paraburkholderia sp. Ac-20340]